MRGFLPAFSDQLHHEGPAWVEEFLARFCSVPAHEVEVELRVGVPRSSHLVGLDTGRAVVLTQGREVGILSIIDVNRPRRWRPARLEEWPRHSARRAPRRAEISTSPGSGCRKLPMTPGERRSRLGCDGANVEMPGPDSWPGRSGRSHSCRDPLDGRF
jgi:hypothetical protein